MAQEPSAHMTAARKEKRIHKRAHYAQPGYRQKDEEKDLHAIEMQTLKCKRRTHTGLSAAAPEQAPLPEQAWQAKTPENLPHSVPMRWQVY